MTSTKPQDIPVISKKKTWQQKFAILVFYSSIITLIYLATTHQTPVIKISHADKLQHFAAFGWLTLLAYFGWRHNWFVRFLMILSISAGIEVAQHFLSHRTASYYDLGANALGIILTEIFVISFFRKKQNS